MKAKLGSVLLQPFLVKVSTMSTALPTLEYCFVCSLKLTAITGRVLLRPLKASEARSSIPLQDQRFTMCKTHADQAVASGDYAIVDEGDQRITG